VTVHDIDMNQVGSTSTNGSDFFGQSTEISRENGRGNLYWGRHAGDAITPLAATSVPKGCAFDRRQSSALPVASAVGSR